VAEDSKPAFDQWCICELLGHKRLAGRVTEVTVFGQAMARVDIPNAEGGFSTQFFGGASIYRLSPVTEEVARAVALHCHPEPVHSWELPKQLPAAVETPAWDGQRADGEHGTYTGEFSQDDADTDEPCSLPECEGDAVPGCANYFCAKHCRENCKSECPIPRF
jgi:hypothetical protein